MSLAVVVNEVAPLASRSKGQREPSNADDNVTKCRRHAAMRRRCPVTLKLYLS